MRIPTQPGSSNAAPAPTSRPNHASPAAAIKPPGLHLSPLASVCAIFGIGGIAYARHAAGNLDIIAVGWTTAFAIGAIGFAGIAAQGAFKTFKSNGFANFAFASLMILTSAGIVLFKGPAHNFAVAQLSTCWPTGAQLLAKTDPSGPAGPAAAAPGASSTSKKTVKGEPSIKVYRKSDQSAGVQPAKGD